MPGPQDAVTEALIRQRKLSSRDAAIARQVAPGFDPEQESRLRESNIQALNAEINRARDPKIRAVLMQELSRLQPQNLVGPVGSMLRPPEGPQPGVVYSDSQPSVGMGLGYSGGDDQMNQPAFTDPRNVGAYEQRNHGVFYPPHGGVDRYVPRKM